MEFLDQMLKLFFDNSVRDDALKLVVGGLALHELHSMRTAMESGFAALTARIDNHEKRIDRIEAHEDHAAGTAD